MSNNIKIQKVGKYIPFVLINNMECIKHNIMSRFPKLVFVKELQRFHEFKEKLIINYIIQINEKHFKITSI